MPSYTSDVLITRVKDFGSVPEEQPRFTDSNFLDMLNDEMIQNIAPLITSIREEWFVEYSDITIVSTQYEYAIPTRAIGGALREVEIYDSGVTGTQAFTPLSRISIHQKSQFADGFYLRGNKVYLINPTSYSGKTLRLTYERRPNYLVATTAVGLISAIDTGALTVTVGTAPATFITAAQCDFIKGTPHFEWRGIDYAISSVASNVITFASLPSDLAVGDYLCLAQESPIAQVPLEAQNLLCQGAVLKMFESLGDAEGMQLADSKYEKMKLAFYQSLSPRVQLAQKKFNNLGGFTRPYRFW